MNQKIIDSTGTLSVRALRSGMMGGITSPARPWFKLSTPDQDLAEYGSVKQWLSGVTDRMSAHFLKSNLYNCLPLAYGDLGVFGTSPISIEEDFKDPFRFYSFPVGSYYIANSHRGKVEVFMREFRMTVRQLIEKFGKQTKSGAPDWSIFSDTVKNAYDQGFYEQWIDVVHVIEPNEEYDDQKLQSKYKAFSSCYYERGSSLGNQQSYLDSGYDKTLSEAGYDNFPILCPRWEVTGEDVYGTDCPGMTALGDVKQLQMGERRALQAIEKMINPPMIAPISMKTSKTSIVPGDINYADIREGTQGFKPAHEINFRLTELDNRQEMNRSRIRKAFYEDLFLMLSTTDRRDITAREIDERHEEKLLALGPVLEQLNQDLLDPLIDNSFDILNKQGRLPPPPPELQGQPLKVEYVSIMAQAQKLVGISGIERFANFAGQIAQAIPSALDKVDADQMLEIYSDITSIPAGIVRTEEQVKGIRDQKAKQMQAQQMAEHAPALAGAAKDLSQTNVTEPNALTNLLQRSQAGA